MMYTSVFVGFAVLLLASAASAHVVELDPESFDDIVNGTEPLLCLLFVFLSLCSQPHARTPLLRACLLLP